MTPPQEKAAGRIPELAGLRGLAFFLVPFWHYVGHRLQAFASPAANVAARPCRLTTSGVDLFVALPRIAPSLLTNPDSTALLTHPLPWVLLLYLLGFSILAILAGFSLFEVAGFPRSPAMPLALAFSYTAMLLLGATERLGPVSWLLRRLWLRGLGIVAYGVYLLYQGVNGLLHAALRSQPLGLHDASDVATTLLAAATTQAARAAALAGPSRGTSLEPSAGGRQPV